MAAITATQCHHSPDTSVMMADTTRAETSMLGLFKASLLTRGLTGLVLQLTFRAHRQIHFPRASPAKPPGEASSQLVDRQGKRPTSRRRHRWPSWIG